MSNYCDFNPKRFKEFVSKHKKIVPQLADDWKIIPKTWRGSDGFSLKSEKIQQEVADINLRRFLTFCEEQNLVIEGLKLKGNYIIGSDRSVYTEEMYNQWKDKFEKRTENIIPKSEWKVGHEYLTPCGKTEIYLGDRYVSNIRESAIKEHKFNDITKISKKSYIMSARNYIDTFRGKFTLDKGQKLTLEECDERLDEFYNRSLYITYFGKELIKNPKYGLIEHELPKKYYKDYYRDGWTLVGKKDETYYIGSSNTRLKTQYYGPEIELPEGSKPDIRESYHKSDIWQQQFDYFVKSQKMKPGFYIHKYKTINPETFEVESDGYYNSYSYRNNQTQIKLDKTYRIGIKED